VVHLSAIQAAAAEVAEVYRVPPSEIERILDNLAGRPSSLPLCDAAGKRDGSPSVAAMPNPPFFQIDKFSK
jgi:hypothetical protein